MLFPEVGGVLDRALGSLVSACVRAQHTAKCTGAQREDCVSPELSQAPDSASLELSQTPDSVSLELSQAPDS